MESVLANIVRETAAATLLCTVSVRFAECAKLPLAPCAVIEILPVAAVADAPNSSVALDPLCTENGLCGLQLTPEGRPLRVTCTEPENPFSGCTDTWIPELVVP